MKDLLWHYGTRTTRLEWQCVKQKPLSIILQSALCSALSQFLSNLWVTLLSAGFLLFFSSTRSLSASWKLAGQLSCLSLMSVLNTNTQGLRNMGLRKTLKWCSEVRWCFCTVSAVGWVLYRGAFPFTVYGTKWTMGRAEQNVALLVDHLITPFLSTALWLKPKLQHYPVLKWFCGMFRVMCRVIPKKESPGMRAHLKSKIKLQK